MKRAALVIALAAVLLGPGGALAAPATLPDVEDEVMCVTCNVPLNIAETPQADRQRAFIRELIARGKDKEQVKEELVAAYGTDVLALPESDGFGLTAYLIPLALLFALIGGLALLLPRWRRSPAAGGGGAGDTAAAGASALSSADARRLDEDLRRYEL